MKILLILVLALGIAYLLHDRSKVQAELAETQTKLTQVEETLQAAKAAQEKAQIRAQSAESGAGLGKTPPLAPSSPQQRKSPDWFNEHVKQGSDRMAP